MPHITKPSDIGLHMTMIDCVVRGDNGRVLLSVPKLQIDKGTSLGIYGPSGAGKTTMLYCIAGLIDNVEGSIYWGETDLLQLKAKDRTQYRSDHIGMIFQDFHLFDELGALTNASLSAMYVSQEKRANLKKHAKVILEHLGLDDVNAPVNRLSGGERQRVAVARALAQEKSILLADEPTASLNREMADSLTDDLIRYVKAEGQTLITVSHDINLLSRMDRTVELKSGIITNSTKFKAP
jgi:putative ABC transport system ATP-binding protein